MPSNFSFFCNFWCFAVCSLLGGVFFTILINFQYEEPKLPVIDELQWSKQPFQTVNESIIPFHPILTEADILDLKIRLEHTQYADTLRDVAFNYGFNSDTLKVLVDYWRTSYDWTRFQAELDMFNHYITNIQGIDIHFMHIKPKSSHKTSYPLLMIHGWPGSFYEFLKIIPFLSDPLNNGGSEEDQVFEIIVPSIPGFGFSEAPHRAGFDQVAAAQIFLKLMDRLGFRSFYVQGGDWGSVVASNMAVLYPDRIRGLRVNFMSMGVRSFSYIGRVTIGYLFPWLIWDDKDLWKVYPVSEKVKYTWDESGYFHLQMTKPDTIGCALNDSPVGLAAWILEKFSTWTKKSNRNLPNGGLMDLPGITLHELLSNVVIYWKTQSITSSMRFLKEFWLSDRQFDIIRDYKVRVLTGYAVFPEELAVYPESLVRIRFPNLVSYTDMPTGGHFAAIESTELLANDIQKFVKIVEDIYRKRLNAEYKKLKF